MTERKDTSQGFQSQTLGPDDPWLYANEIERAQAAELVRVYAANNSAGAQSVADAYGCPAWMIRQARWLALAAGLLTRTAQEFTPTDKGVCAFRERGVA